MQYTKINSAVIKQILSQMDREYFIKEAQHIKALLLEIDPEKANERQLLKNLYQWCKTHYSKRFK